MSVAERIRAHTHFHDTIVLDCYPGICPFRDRRETLERRNVFSKWGWWKMMWYVVWKPDNRRWTERRGSRQRKRKEA